MTTNPYRDMPVLPSVNSILAARRAAYDAGTMDSAPSMHDLISEKIRRDRIARGVPVEGTDSLNA